MRHRKNLSIRDALEKYLSLTDAEYEQLKEEQHTQSEKIAIQTIDNLRDDPQHNFNMLKFIIEQLDGKAVERKETTIKTADTPTVKLQFVQTALDTLEDE